MNGQKKKILVITGTRAEYGLLKTTIDGIRSSKILSLRLLVTGMHTLKRYGLTINEIKKDRLQINFVVTIDEADDMLSALSKEIFGVKEACLKDRPAAILVLGDRDEPFAGAIVGAHLKIPVLHIHGGDVTGYVVDDYIRQAITKFSHLHFTVSQKSYERVIKLGEEKWRVFKVGAPGLDALGRLKYYSKKELAKKLKLNIDNKWLIILQHPTPLDKTTALKQIKPTLNACSGIRAEKIVIYPNSDTGGEELIKEMNKYKNLKNWHIFKNFDRRVYLSLLKYSDVLIGNSSSGIIESGFFHLPVINIGNRQLGRECGHNVIRADYKVKQIRAAIKIASSEKFKRRCLCPYNFYGQGGVGEKIVKIIEKNINNPDLFYKKFIYAEDKKN